MAAIAPNGFAHTCVLLIVMPVQSVPREAPPVSDFESFFRSVYPSLAQALTLLSGAQGSAEELAQEALLRAYERWDRVSRMENAAGYVYRTAVNLHRSRLRRLRALARRRLFSDVPPTETVEAVENKTDALALLRSLPLTQREAVALVLWLGLTAEEAALILGIDAASVRGRIHRARQTLRRRSVGSHG
jgi:RNA polymerase sigma factor (sigma-70 family)